MNWLDFVWVKIALVFVTMLLVHHFLPHFTTIWLDIFVRSTSLMALFAGLVFGLKLSQDLNTTAMQLLKGKFRWF